MTHGLSFCALALAVALAGDQQASRIVQIEVRVEGPGRVEMVDGRICGPNSSCSQPVAYRSRVRFKALQEPGVDGRFAGWDGVCRGLPGPECVVTMRSDATVSARFVARK